MSATMLRPMSILVVEDQALLAMELQFLIEDAGHMIVGWATDHEEALALMDGAPLDLAFVDVHLADGPSGTDIAADLLRRNVAVIFMTANVKRVPDDFVGAIGIIAKPYTASGVLAALAFLHPGVLAPPPTNLLPAGLTLSPNFAGLWAQA